MAAIKAIETSLAAPAMAAFSRHLWARRIPHRVHDDGSGTQSILVLNEAHAAFVQEDYRRWCAGDLQLQTRIDVLRMLRSQLLHHLRTTPLTLVLIALSALGCLTYVYDQNAVLLRWLTFSDVELIDGKAAFVPVATTYARGQWWRLLTPMFLHANLLHLAFNTLWVWLLGRPLERARGAPTLLAVTLLAGAGGNIAQYIVGGNILFGGMSGVVYGLIGYMWLWSRIMRDPRLAIPPILVGAMILWLLLCTTGLIEALGFGAIMNSMHAAGLALGALLGVGAALLYSPPAPPA